MPPPKKPTKSTKPKSKSARAAAKPAARSSSRAAPKGKGDRKAATPKRAAAPKRKDPSTKPPRKSAPSVNARVEDNRARDKAMLAAKAALDRKAEDVIILDVRGLSGVADFFVVCSGNGARMVNAIAEGVDEQLAKAGHKILSSEGQTGGRWVLLDFADVVIHVFEPETRATYDLEGNWVDAPRERVTD